MPYDSPTQPELRSAFHDLIRRPAKERGRVINRPAVRDFEIQILVVGLGPGSGLIDVLHPE